MSRMAEVWCRYQLDSIGSGNGAGPVAPQPLTSWPKHIGSVCIGRCRPCFDFKRGKPLMFPEWNVFAHYGGTHTGGLALDSIQQIQLAAAPCTSFSPAPAVDFTHVYPKLVGSNWPARRLAAAAQIPRLLGHSKHICSATDSNSTNSEIFSPFAATAAADNKKMFYIKKFKKGGIVDDRTEGNRPIWNA